MGQPTRPLNAFPPGFPAPGTGKRSLSIEEAVQLHRSFLDAEKAAYAQYGGKPALTLTVRPDGTGHDASADRVARLGLITVMLGAAAVEGTEAAGFVTLVVGAAPVALATLAALTAGVIIIKLLGKVFRFSSGSAAAAFLQGLLHGADLEGFDLPRLPPVSPVPVPPSVGALGVNPGLVPAAPTPTQPGFTPAPPIPLVPPAAAPHPPVGMVLENRNRGLRGGARTYSDRARAAARRADSEVVRHLEEAEWVAHHLVNISAIRRAKDLIDAAVRAGWWADGESNTAALPRSAEAQRKLQAVGVRRPLHNSGHSDWNEYVRRQLGQIRKEVKNTKFKNEQERDEEIKNKLDDLTIRLRNYMMRNDRITSNEEFSNVLTV